MARKPEILPPEDAKTTVTVHPSGARTVIVTGKNFRMAHFEGPWHEGDILDLIHGLMPRKELP